MQQGIRGQGSTAVSCKTKEKGPDTNPGIVAKLKEAMSQWRKYSKAEAAEDRNTFLQKK
jgi:hypothetical protein